MPKESESLISCQYSLNKLWFALITDSVKETNGTFLALALLLGTLLVIVIAPAMQIYGPIKSSIVSVHIEEKEFYEDLHRQQTTMDAKSSWVLWFQWLQAWWC